MGGWCDIRCMLPSLRGWGTPPLGPGFPEARGPLGRARGATVGRLTSALFDRGLPALNEARRTIGLEPIAHVLDTYDGPSSSCC